MPIRDYSDNKRKKAIGFWKGSLGWDQGRIEIVGDEVRLFGFSRNNGSYRDSRTHTFLLSEPDSILWIERYVAAGINRWFIELTGPSPVAIDDCDND